ncbi:cell adhesion molecule Dscam2-like isoform X2 [Mytilus edulis]|uniref:cell adhesion molecule Dscam2-like isoform X2 n=1 Tax=Mytilus edulis TaxID=6550 RepID=UPI0039EE4912
MVDSDDWKKIGRGRSFVTSYTIKNLKLDKHYVCSVSAENKVGKGPAAEVESPVVQHQKPVKAIEKARTSKQSIKDKKENEALYSDVVKKNLTSRPTTVKSIGKASPSQPSFKNKKGGNKVLYCDKFKRNLTSPPIAEVPQAPENLKVKTRTNDKLTLEWTRPKAIGDSKVTGYNISLKMVDSDDWKKIGRGRSFVTSYTIKNLKLDKHYVCSVSAENKVGKGPAAEVESPVVQHQKPVKAIEKAKTSKQSIKDKKENEALYSDVVKKNLTSRPITVKSIGKASPSQPSFKNKKGGNKVLYCDKFKKNLTSRPIAEVPQAPANLKVKMRTNDKLTLEWTRPKAIGDSKVTGYNISLKMVDSDDWKKIGRGRSFVTSYTIKNLKLDKHYVCSVSAENKVGKGPAAEVESPVVQHQKPVKAIEKARTSKQSIKDKKENEALYSDVVKKNLTSRPTTVKSIGKASPNQPSFKNKKGGNKVLYCDKFKRNLTSRPIAEVPQAPENLKVKTRTNDKLTLEWTRPKAIGDSKVTGYNISLKMVDSDDWKKIGRGRSFVTSYTIKNLKLDKHYVCSVSAENKVGKGPAAEVESPVVQHQKPVKAIEKARTSKQSIKDKKENEALYSDVVKKNLTSRPTTVKLPSLEIDKFNKKSIWKRPYKKTNGKCEGQKRRPYSVIPITTLQKKTRSGQKKQCTPDEEARQDIQLAQDKDGFVVRQIDNVKGKGVFASKFFKKGDFLMEYHGELISGNDGKRRLTQYPNSVGSYIMFFRFAEKEMCVDATFSKRIGKYVNDGIKSCQNARVRRIIVDTIPRVAIYAVQDISPGTEILYDYGVNDLPWRQSTSKTTQRCSVVLEKMCLADLKGLFYLSSI